MDGGGEEVTLLKSWFSPFSCRVEWALKLKGVAYEVVEEDVINKSPNLLKHNPVFKKVPVLVHQGKAIVESFNIIEYIDETWSHKYPIMPLDPYEKANARFWAHFVDEKLHKAIRRVKVFEGEKKEREVNEAKEALEAIEGEMKKGKMKFFEGDSVGFLDIVLGWITLWLGVFEELSCVKIFDSQKFPLLHKWMLNFLDLQMIKETLPPRDKLLVALKTYGQLTPTQATRK